MTRIACIGSRETPPNVRAWMEDFGAKLVYAGHIIVSGNAPGADHAWAYGGNKVDPTKVELRLPWTEFELPFIHRSNVVCLPGLLEEDAFAREIAASLHPRWGQLASGARALLTRDVMIVRDVRLVIGYVDSQKKFGGGTGFSFRVAKRFEIPCIDVVKASERHRLECALRDGKLEELMKPAGELEPA